MGRAPHQRRRSSAVATLVALVLAAPAVGSGAGAGEGGPTPLLPDLKTKRPNDVRVERRSESETGQKLLRFTNEIVNQGAGPLEIVSEEACPGQGPDTRVAWQSVFEDTNGSGYYESEADESMAHEVGCTALHERHGHYHLQDFASYELYELDAGTVGGLVAASEKVGFCLVDTLHPKPDLPSSPTERVYNGEGCQVEGEGKPTGISIGWSDVYQSYLPHQWIPIGGVANGTYCLRSTADPLDKLSESKNSNNRRGLAITLSGVTVDYKPRRPCVRRSPGT